MASLSGCPDSLVSRKHLLALSGRPEVYSDNCSGRPAGWRVCRSANTLCVPGKGGGRASSIQLVFPVSSALPRSGCPARSRRGGVLERKRSTCAGGGGHTPVDLRLGLVSLIRRSLAGEGQAKADWQNTCSTTYTVKRGGPSRPIILFAGDEGPLYSQVVHRVALTELEVKPNVLFVLVGVRIALVGY